MGGLLSYSLVSLSTFTALEELCWSDAGCFESSAFSANAIISVLSTVYFTTLATGATVFLVGAGGLLPLPLDWLPLGTDGFLSAGAFLSYEPFALDWEFWRSTFFLRHGCCPG
jgi:hypothetical protein